MNDNAQVFDEIPPGWSILHGATTAPCGYKLISNGESRFNPQYQIGLVKCKLSASKVPETPILAASDIKAVSPTLSKTEKQSGVCFSDKPELPKRLNQLAREETKLRLLRDIAADITVCQLEGWEYKDYLHELQETIQQFLD